ncbi:acyl-homoserine-lactone synthase, partial [Pseudomonas syringae group genomosp. 7]|uniref:acyl-homoserine-lactone synthase n=1 Tax=Pseudomonas syringae group genomosp. 7 TaxID=251699 RepID=UPI00376FE416
NSAPKNTIMAESSRCFVDSVRARSLGFLHAPVTEMLLFSMHNHAALSGLQSIISGVSRAMARIVRKSGWEHRVLAAGAASP